MNYFLMFLIHNLNTIDGTRGSAAPILKVLNQQSNSDNKKLNEH